MTLSGWADRGAGEVDDDGADRSDEIADGGSPEEALRR
jgi:hypothetical protein